MILSQKNLNRINGKVNSLPTPEIFRLPEKVLQFGTGVLLRALPDYFIDKANKQGIFNGRIVAVKSTSHGNTDAFKEQDGLYTICVRGMDNGVAIQEDIINASLSRVLNANSEWEKVLECARNPLMQIILSNTTEVGIQLTDDDLTSSPPFSFPGKLLGFLYERFRFFNGSEESGMLIIPTELISDNGTILKSILLELAHRNKLEYAFLDWLENQNTFCNSLVDRIVPGRPATEEIRSLEARLGYHDELLTKSEVFRLWAIEGDEKVEQILSFCQADEGVQVLPDITVFKELKLRLLNGTHSFNCGLAFLSGFNVTREAITDPLFSQFAKQLMLQEIVPAIPYSIEQKTKEEFAHKVFERFCNPYIDHPWLNITVQYTSKMKTRNVPLLQTYFDLYHTPPVYMATGFAGFLYFMKSIRKENNKYFGIRNGQEYEILDDEAAYFFEVWHKFTPERVVYEVLKNKSLWDADLTCLPEFEKTVAHQLLAMIHQGPRTTIRDLVDKKETIK